MAYVPNGGARSAEAAACPYAQRRPRMLEPLSGADRERPLRRFMLCQQRMRGADRIEP